MRTQHEIDAAFHAYDEQNPQVYAMFKRFAYEALVSGHHYFSAKAVVERVRWETAVTAQGDTFKINNNYTSRYVRKLIAEKPQFEGFFRLRKLHS